jgi:hypothetical protein
VKEVGLVDTQGGIGFQALPAVADRLTFESPLQVGLGGRRCADRSEGRPAPGDLRIGRHVFTRPRIAVHELPPEIPSTMTIGLRALHHFALTVDRRSIRVRFAGPDTTVILD